VRCNSFVLILLTGFLLLLVTGAAEAADPVAQKAIRDAFIGAEADEKPPEAPVTPEMSLEEIRRLKEQIEQYKKALKEPPDVKGERTVLPYVNKPQKIRGAIGYGTVIRVPFDLREKNGYLVGNPKAFRVIATASNEIAIFPLVRFWRTNVFLFPGPEDGRHKHPVVLTLLESLEDGAHVDFLVSVEDAPTQVDVRAILRLALQGTLGSSVLDKIRKPKKIPIKDKRSLRTAYKLSSPGYYVPVLNGSWECLRGCDLWLEDPSSGLTVAGVFPGVTAEFCEKKAARFAERKCVKFERK